MIRAQNVLRSLKCTQWRLLVT